jgi:Na+-driven multidrug efflux pump
MYTNKQIWSVSYPILLSLLAQNVINVTDTAFLGHVSEVALGASAMGGLFYICIFTIAGYELRETYHVVERGPDVITHV